MGLIVGLPTLLMECGGFRDSYSAFGGANYGSNSYRSAAGYDGRPGRYAGYGGSEYCGSLGGFKEERSGGYGGRLGPYGDGFCGYGSGMIGGYGAGGDGAYGDLRKWR